MASSATDLARLLETERRLGAQLQSARLEAEALVERARASAAQREAALAVDLERDEHQLTERLTLERRAREREIADAAQKEVAFYHSLSPERLTAVARRLASRLLDGGS